VSLRTNQAAIEVDFVEVWQSRGSSQVISVGPTGALATQNANPTTPAGRVHTLVQDSAGNWSSPTYTDVNVDWTPPASSAEVRDGLGPDENTTPIGTQLSANWDPTTNPHSDLLTYEYAIGTAPGTPDVVNWTPAGLTTSVTHTGLSLTNGQTYYFGVQAVNNAGLTSTPTWSNGILYSQPLFYDAGAADSILSTNRPAVRLYPNPTTGAITVTGPDSLLPLLWFLYDSQGRLIRSGELRSLPVSFDLFEAGDERGVYFWYVP
jgi:hypothetical protein